MPPPRAEADSLLASLREQTGARAAGWWRVGPAGLEQVAFSAAPDLPAEVAAGFADATRSVPLSATTLGIVKAAVDGTVAVSRAPELPADAGSGFWLRRFGADRSVAVPLFGSDGRVTQVVSVAVSDRAVSGLDTDLAVAAAVREAATRWVEGAVNRAATGQPSRTGRE